MTCPTCREALPEGFKFCGHCGASLARPASEAERRQLTVMFCDLVGSTRLSEQLDTELLRELIRGYQAFCSEIVDRCQGHIAQYLGDGLLIYFGYPHAYGDDPRRALTCGVEILERLGYHNEHLEERHGLGLSLRLGVHTGEVIVGEVGAGERRENLALGDTPNIAARLQSLAQPDTIVVSQATFELTRDDFDFAELGEQNLKGLSRGTRAYRVLGSLDARLRRQRLRARQAALPLIGRDPELERLREAWQRTRKGHGGSVLVRAEEGMGKRRLVQVLKDQVVADGDFLMTCYCAKTQQAAPLRPVVDMLERDLQLARDDSPAEKWNKLEEALLSHAPSLAPELALPILGRLLLNVEETQQAPAQTRRLTLQCLQHFVLERSRARPLLLVVDSVQEADPTTLEWLQQLLRMLERSRLLAVCVGHEEVDLPVDEGLRLGRLDRAQSAQVVEHLTSDRRLPGEVIAYIVNRADGVPMFLEEITRLVLESDVLRETSEGLELRGSLAHLGVPATLYDTFMARLDRLGPARELVQWGAVLGGDLDPALLAPLTGRSHEELEHLLEPLVAEALLRRTPNGYALRHPLTQEVAYRSLLRTTRAEFHRRAARALEEHRLELVQARPDLLARHYQEGGQIKRAIGYWLAAGQRALAYSAPLEAVSALRQALEGLQQHPDPARELEVHTALGPALIATRGYGALEVEATYQRARQLCRALGETMTLFPVLCGLWVFYLARGELDLAQDLAGKLERLAENQSDPAYRLLAEAARGQTAFWRGDFEGAETLLSAAVARHNPANHSKLAFTYFDTDPVAGSWSYLAWNRLVRGDLSAAREADARARELSDSLNHPHTSAHALFFSSWLELALGDLATAGARAERLGALALQESFPLWVAVARVLDSWSQLGREPNAPEQLALALERVQATGARLGATWFVSLPAQMLAAAGQREQALAMLGQALTTCEEFQERWFEPELRRLRALLLVGEESLAGLETALALARSQGARTWELRCAISRHEQRPDEVLAELRRQFPVDAVSGDLARADELLA